MSEKYERGSADLGGEVFEDGGQVDGGSGADTLRIFAGLEETGNTTDRELKAGLATAGGGFLCSSSTTTT